MVAFVTAENCGNKGNTTSLSHPKIFKLFFEKLDKVVKSSKFYSNYFNSDFIEYIDQFLLN